MPRYRIYVLKQRTYSSMRARYGDDFRCSQCQRVFQLYDMVMSKPSRRGSKAKWYHLYHLSCYEALLID
jgi:hypothetical protein